MSSFQQHFDSSIKTLQCFDELRCAYFADLIDVAECDGRKHELYNEHMIWLDRNLRWIADVSLPKCKHKSCCGQNSAGANYYPKESVEPEKNNNKEWILSNEFCRPISHRLCPNISFWIDQVLKSLDRRKCRIFSECYFNRLNIATCPLESIHCTSHGVTIETEICSAISYNL